MSPPRRALASITALWIGFTASAVAHAAGELYLGGNLAISGGSVDSGGSTPFFSNTGSDSDSSPSFSGAFGFEVPMNQMLPVDWNTGLPSWHVRSEIEGVGGIDYEFTTQGAEPYHTDVTAWSLLTNLWIDFPVHEPIGWLFGRIPILEPLTLYGGAGIGLGSTTADVSNVASGKDTVYDFAWQAGTGLSYELTRRVSVSAGYRYFDLPDADIDLSVGSTPFGNLTLDLASHEFVAALRVRFFSISFSDR